MSRRKKISFTSVGGSSILTIFAVLCFIVFALLTLSTAKADRRLADKSADAVTAYYAADTQAEEILASLRGGTVPEGVRTEADGTYSYSCPIGDSQELQVRVQIQGDACKVLEWKKTYTGQWKADDSIEVYGGTEITD